MKIGVHLSFGPKFPVEFVALDCYNSPFFSLLVYLVFCNTFCIYCVCFVKHVVYFAYFCLFCVYFVYILCVVCIFV